MLFDMPLLRMKSRDPTWRLIPGYLRMDDRSRPLPGSMDPVSAAPLQTQELKCEGAVFSVSMKRVHYSRQSSCPPSSSSSSCSPSHDSGHLQWRTVRVKTLRCGWLWRLVEALAPMDEEVDVSYRTCFLCTYRTFAMTEEVLQLLARRYSEMDPQPGDCAQEVKLKGEVQSSILSFLHVWLESYPADFLSPPSHPLHSHLHMLTQHSEDLARIAETVTRGVASNGSHSNTNEGTASGLPSVTTQFNLFSLPADEFAQALTAKDAAVFLAVVPHHCLTYVRGRGGGGGGSVKHCIDHFNAVSFVVIATVLAGVEPEGRGHVISRWIDVAHHCRLLKNFSSLKSITSGLTSSAVHRLRGSWAAVASESTTLFGELSDLFVADDNHHISRELLNREGTAKYAEVSSSSSHHCKRGKGGHNNGRRLSVQGVVPYLGTFLTDLTMLHTAHPDTTEDGLINFDKRRKEFELLAQLTLYQKSAGNYSLPRHPRLEQWLTSTHTLSEPESYQLSKQLEADPSDPPGVTLSPPPPTSPSLLKRTFKNLIHCKGPSFMSDSARVHDRITPCLSELDLRNSGGGGGGRGEGGDGGRGEAVRCASVSPSFGRRAMLRSESDSPGLVARVAFSRNDNCNYKSLLVMETDKTVAVIQQAMLKHNLEGHPAEFSLFHQLPDSRLLRIPLHCNLYYAISHEESPGLILKRLECAV